MFSIWSLLRESTEGGAGGERWREEEEKPKHTDRRGGQGWGTKRGSKRSGDQEGGGERRDQGDQRGASDTEGAARTVLEG